MTIIIIIALAVIIFGVIKHDEMSYKKYYERGAINSKQPDWTYKCSINFLEKDPQWFINNGYGEWVN